MPVPVALNKSLVHNHKILLFGGDDFWSTSSSQSTNLIQEYDPETDSWRLMKSMPFKRSSMGGGKVGGYVFLIGGYLDDRDPDTKVSEVWKFNLDSLQEGCEEVSIMEPSENLAIGDEVTLSADVLPSDFANKTIVWSSDNESVVTVLDSLNGTFRCESEGTATINAKLKYGGCEGSYMLTVSDSAGTIIPETKSVDCSLYPNPIDNLLNVSLGSSLVHRVEISAVTGQLVYSDLMDSSEYIIDLSNFEKGIYFVTIRSKEFIITKKIIKR